MSNASHPDVERDPHAMMAQYYTERLAEQHAQVSAMLDGIRGISGEGTREEAIRDLKNAARSFAQTLRDGLANTSEEYPILMPFLSNGSSPATTEAARRFAAFDLAQQLQKIDSACQQALDAIGQLGWMRV